MSASTLTAVPPVTEKTFSSYNQAQGANYAQIRRDYHPRVYEAILAQHTSTGGQLNTLLDIGCGPGNVTRSLAPHFTHAIGLDPSKGMIETARSLTPDSTNIKFELSTAESLGSHLDPAIEDGSVDLIASGNAAHWFDMAGFWKAAARVVKPGGSVALWTSGEIRAHPDMPNAAAIQAAMDEQREVHLAGYQEAGSMLTKTGYRNLPMPWSLPQPVEGFEKADFWRLDWDPREPFYAGPSEAGLPMFEKMMGTGSAVTRWRQDNPGKEGTEEDVVRLLRRKLEKLLQEAGVEKGQEKLKGTVHGAILVLKKIA